MSKCRFLSALGTLALAAAVLAASRGAACGEGRAKAVEPFNGKDFSGWQFKGDPKQSK